MRYGQARYLFIGAQHGGFGVDFGQAACLQVFEVGGTGATGLAKAANSAKRSSSLLNISRYWKSVGSSFKEVGNSIGRITKDEVVHYSREAAAKEIKDFLLIRTLPGKAAFNAFKGYIQGNWDNVDN